ncbi:hypothetical protein ACLBYG_22500 [Methylobacterium sp. D53M]
MTQILNLPQIDGSRTSFTITKNSVFTFGIAFPYPAGPQVPLVAACAMTAGSAILAGLSTQTVASLVTGQPVAGYGVPAGATISGIPSSTSVQISAPATQSGALVGVTFQPLPLDITGIAFLMQILRAPRDSSGSGNVLLEASTANGRLINGGTSGVLSGSVGQDAVAKLPLSAAPSFVTDIVATASDGGPINLMAASGPASVVVLPGISLP